MDVGKKNFEEILPIVEEAILNADFISIDGEFTGIETYRPLNNFDTPEERYQKLTEFPCNNYLLIQLGLCTFHFNNQKKKYQYKAFNFYIYPRDLKNESFTFPPFSSNPSSLEFLLTNGFDFPKLFRVGIPFIDTSTYSKLKIDLQEKHKIEIDKLPVKSKSTDIISVPKEYQEFINKVNSDIADFLDSENCDSLFIKSQNNREKRLVCKLVNNLFPDGEMKLTKLNKDERLIKLEKVRQINTNHYVAKLEVKQRHELKDLEDTFGFSKVIEIISKSGKLLVGHNMLLDILNIMRQFVCPLPESLKEFKKLVRGTFNCVVDTKVVASSEVFKKFIIRTALPEVVFKLGRRPFNMQNIEPCKGFERYNLSESKLHEAGYDAFITGAALIGLHNYLCKLAKSHEIISSRSKVFAPFLNKVFMMRSYDIKYFDLVGEEDLPIRNYMFQVTFPEGWTMDTVKNYFQSYGDIHVVMLDDTTAYLALKVPGNANRVQQDLVNKPNQPVTVVPYSEAKIPVTCQKAKTRKQKPYSDGISEAEPPKKKKKKSKKLEGSSEELHQ